MKTLNTLRRRVVPALLLVLVALAAGGALADERTDAKLAEARKALNAERYKEAARLYAEVHAQAEDQVLAGDAIYWEAFARYRLQQTAELKKALALLQVQQHRYQAAATAAEGEALAARIAGELAARGEAEAAREIYEAADADRQREEIRVAALHALMQMNPDKALPMLAKIVRGETEASAEMRQNAVFILCQQDERGIEIVLEALPAATDPQMMQAMVMCLAQDESARSLDALLELMRRTDDPEVTSAVMMALGHRGDPRAFDILAEIAQDTKRDPELRAHAMIGLVQSDDDRVVDIALEIINRAGEPDEVLEMSLMALSQNGSKRAGDALMSLAENPAADEELRAMALFNAFAHGTVEVGRLRAIYESTASRDLKIQVCHVLTQAEDEAAALDLMLDIIRTEKDPEIRQNAVFWIGQFDDPRAADALLEIIDGK